MSRQVLFVQGAGKNVHDRWDNKLADSLQQALGADYVVLYPRMPAEEDPQFTAWKAALLREFADLEEDAILVGHSVGATTLIHVLAGEQPDRKFGLLALLAAPFIGEGGWSSEDITPRTDFAERLPATLPIFLYRGTEDETVSAEHLDLYAKCLPQAVVRHLLGKDHQLGNDLCEVARDIRAAIRERA